MSPKKIVAKSIEKQLDIIAICDHNSAENVQAVIHLGNEMGLYVLPGMEICSREEVHILGLFKAVEQAQAMQEFVYEHLPGENQAEVFGYQVIVNEKDEIRGEVSRLLIGASRLSLQDIVVKIHKLGGLSIASHVDRPSDLKTGSNKSQISVYIKFGLVSDRHQYPIPIPSHLKLYTHL